MKGHFALIKATPLRGNRTIPLPKIHSLPQVSEITTRPKWDSIALFPMC